MKCTTCHNPHRQDQRFAYGQESFVVSGTSDSGGITENSLKMTGAGWIKNSLADMVLFPNLANTSYNYKIIGNDADTITVKGPMNLFQTTAGNTSFAVIYGKLIRGTITTPNSGQRAVRLFRDHGANSFADGDATYDGICEVCHTQTSHHQNDGTAIEHHNEGTRCTGCHSHSNGFGDFDHTAAGVVMPVSTCMECHGPLGSDLIGSVHRGQCGHCHSNPLGGGPLVEPYESTLPNGGYCTDCHGPLSTAHRSIEHTAKSSSGTVVIFADNDHESVGWSGPRPYFGVLVDCSICHSNNLPAIHGNNCATCHPTPYNMLETWRGGCQQGGCHPGYHEDSIKAHLPWADTNHNGNKCDLCHQPVVGAVVQSNCLNCHATYGSQDNTPPTTYSNALASYIGPAKIDFSIRASGEKVGIGTTFYQLDGGVERTGSQVLVSAPGLHTLEFWSVDQAGNVEPSRNRVYFTIVEDTTPPATTSDAKATYNQGAWITLTATDDSTLGVKNTYYRLNGGPIETGSIVGLPATNGIIAYTLTFWSEDWSGNVEIQKSVSFTVASGTGTIRLVWGDSDVSGSPCPGDPEANAAWTIRSGSWGGQVIASGLAGCPTWSGVDEIEVPVGDTPYSVTVDWWDSGGGYDDQTWFSNVNVTTPGQVVRLSY